MMKKLFHYGIDRPVITWLSFILGLALLIFHWYLTWLLGIVGLIVAFIMVAKTNYKYRLVDRFLQHCDLRSAAKILDIGSGTGYFMMHMVHAAGYVAFATGMEDQKQNRSRRAWKNARRIGVNNRINMIHGDIRHLPFSVNAFNVVTLMDHSHSLIDTAAPQFAQAVCDDIHRVLKPNGRFIMIANHKVIDQFKKDLENQDDTQVRELNRIKSKFGWRILIMRKTA